MMKHHDAQEPEGEAGPENVGKQVRREESCRIEDAANNAAEDADHCHDQTVALHAPKRGEIHLRVHYFPASGLLCVSLRSRTIAFWLNCSARMYAAIAHRSRGCTRSA